MDFNSYDDFKDAIGYDGFIDKYGNFYKVCKKNKKDVRDSHNEWAKQFIKEKYNINDFKFNPTASAILTLTKLHGSAEILIHCFGYVYYSHDPFYLKPIIKVPNPKISGYKVTSAQLDMLFLIMNCHNEDTNIPLFTGEEFSEYEEDGYQYTLKY